ncbi:MAG: hypothetical protein Q7R95_04195 [bacterium]|nr:hypothetical protein [bacterium]
MSELPKSAAQTRIALIDNLLCVKRRTTNTDVGCRGCGRPGGLQRSDSELFANKLIKWNTDDIPSSPCITMGLMGQTTKSQLLIEHYRLLMEQSKHAQD